MQPDDLTLEVLDVNLRRQAVIPSKYWTDLKALATLRGVGAWSMSLPASLPAAQTLAQPGGCILLTGPDGELFSGPVTKPTDKADQSDPAGTIVFSGTDFNLLPQDALAYPTPATADVTAQTVAYDVQTGAAETAIRALIDANIGPSAPAGRRGPLAQLLQLDVDQGRGGAVTITSRFDNLLTQAATAAQVGGIGFRITVPAAGTLLLQFFEPQDKSKLIRLDIANGRLTSYEHSTNPPLLTRSIVGGQGDLTARAFLEATTADALAAEAAWGRRIEVFKDDTSAATAEDLQKSADDELANGAYTVEQLKLTPTDDETMRYQRDWFLGDYIAAVVRGVEIAQVVTEVAIGVSKDGVIIGATVGDLDADDIRNLQTLRRLHRLETRK